MFRLRHLIRTRVIFLSLTFTALIALSVSLASVWALYRTIFHATAQSTEYNLQIVANNLYQSIAEIDQLADWCTVDSTMRNFVFSSSPVKQVLDVYNLMLNKYSSLRTSRYLRRVLVTSGENRIMQQGTALAQSQALTAETVPLLPGFENGTKDDSWSTLCEDPLIWFGQKEVIPVIRTMSASSGGETAKVYIAVSSDLITDTIHDYSLMQDNELFWFMGENIWNIEDGSLTPFEGNYSDFIEEENPNQLVLLDRRTRVLEYQGKTLLAYPVGTHNLYIVQALPEVVLLGQLPTMLIPFIGALAAILLLGHL